ncbi:MAG: type II secretion system F family protein [Candidatus Bathyarchaeia archaeon]|jgi:flagellar protein FlaJ
MKFQPWTTAYTLLNKKLERIYPQFQEIHLQLKKGGVLIAFKAYIAFMVLLSIIVFAAAIPVSFILLPLLTGISILSVMNFAFSLVIGASAAMVTLIVMYIYPGMKASNRKGPIDKNLPYISNFLTLLSSSNVPPSLIFESMAKIDTLKEVRLEFSNIIRDIEIFGNDLMTSIVDNAKLTPNDKLGEILEGYVATVRTGGNPTEYLKITTDAVTKDRLGKLDMMLESLSAMAEIYIMMLVAAPLLFIVLFVTLGMIGSGTIGGLSMSLVLYLLTYLGIPIMGTIMMVIMSTFEK